MSAPPTTTETPVETAGHDPHLAHHFEDAVQQYEAGKLGMWIFLSTEILLFGGLFCAYAVYRATHPEIFVYAHQYLDKVLGGINTLVLICSSFTMAWGVRAAQMGKRRALMVLLSLTIALAFVFLGIKFVEYQAKWKHGLLWGTRYHPHVEAPARAGEAGAAAASGAAAESAPGPLPAAPATDLEERSAVPPAATGPAGLAQPGGAPRTEPTAPPRNVQIFFGIYFVMTGLHGLHVVAGMILLGWMLVRSARGEFGPSYFTPVDLAGLYWHLVDLIWIYLFPLLYLIH